MKEIKDLIKCSCIIGLIFLGHIASANNVSTVEEVISLISGEVWVDNNGNGTRDAGEPIVANSTVKLYDSSNTLITTTTTGSGGIYFFAVATTDQYYVEFEAPTGFDFTFADLGTDNSVDSDVTGIISDGATDMFQVIDGQDVTDVDAGVYKCIPIGDLVWYDSNQNDTWDTNENGINGLLVNLYRANSDTTYVKWDSQYTGANIETPSDDGYYKFCAPPGKYYIEIVLPQYGLVNVIPNVGSNEEIDNDITNAFGAGTTDSLIVESGDDVCDLGAGYYPKAKIGNYTFIDNNINGIQDVGDEPLPGVIVKLFLASGVQVGDSIITDVNGEYCFDYLGKGDYYLEFTPPAAYIVTLTNAGDDGLDSDIDHSNGANTSTTYTLAPGDTNLTVDAGFHFPVVPVELIDFVVSNDRGLNHVYWSTAQEYNSSYFEIERRHESEGRFNTIAKLDAAGNSTSTLTYHFTDSDVRQNGLYYYRLKQVDNDGSYNTSDVVSVLIDRLSKSEINIYPNPTTDRLFIELSDDQVSSIVLLKADGQLVEDLTSKANLLAGEKTINFDLGHLTEGMYYISIVTGEQVVTKAIFVTQ